jgi:adhesin/invasin
MKSTNYLIMLLFTLLVIAGCSANDSTSTPPSQDAVDDQISADDGSYSLQLSVPTLTPGTLLSHGGQVTVRAYMSYTTTDTDGDVTRHPVADGTVVNFFVIDAAGSSQDDAIFNAGTIESSKTTVNGYADATYSADNYGGMVKIYAGIDDNAGEDLSYVSDSYSFEVASGAPVAISVGSITPATINVAGTGKTNRSLLTFSLTDNAGNPVPDFTSVTFTISPKLNGLEKLSQAEAETQNGLVSVSLIAGTVSGTVGVNASYYNAEADVTISTEAKVTIVSGLPAAERLSMGVQYFNLAGGRTFGLQNDITAYLGDRYGNVVPDGTTVSFMSECGTIGTSDGFQSTTTRGVAYASLQTSAPTAPSLGGVDGSAPALNPALCRIVAYTPGDEGFNDVNGNNVYDEGTDVQTIDMSEPYIDANDNGVYDSGEKYIDVDGSGLFTQADGVYQSNTMIWHSVTVLMSDDQAPLNLQPTNFNIVDGGSQTFSYMLGDIWGNSLVGGTMAKVTVTGGGTVSGDVDITVADSLDAEQQYFFTLTMPADTSEITSIEVTVEVTPAGGDAGSNSSSPVSARALGLK